ncbi:unnamed protein product [Linum tenue]|uniref:Uncharacterized protein n=1 Tax=Linum tenue TaxID=586396 RepID=A0AAV0PHV7_9ROSI|nr:unnamed protein product [Linum tenue]
MPAATSLPRPRPRPLPPVVSATCLLPIGHVDPLPLPRRRFDPVLRPPKVIIHPHLLHRRPADVDQTEPLAVGHQVALLPPVRLPLRRQVVEKLRQPLALNRDAVNLDRLVGGQALAQLVRVVAHPGQLADPAVVAGSGDVEPVWVALVLGDVEGHDFARAGLLVFGGGVDELLVRRQAERFRHFFFVCVCEDVCMDFRSSSIRMQMG